MGHNIPLGYHSLILTKAHRAASERLYTLTINEIHYLVRGCFSLKLVCCMQLCTCPRSSNNIRSTERAVYHIDCRRMGLGQFDGQGEYCGLRTASKVFLTFTTHLHSCLCNYNAIVFIS